MKNSLIAAAALALISPAVAEPPQPAPSPADIVASAPAKDWIRIDPSDLLVLELAPLGNQPRRVLIQLMPAPFSQGWIGNIRMLAAVRWWDGTSIYRVQDNYVVQWGDASDEKPLPKGLRQVPESDYAAVLSQSPEIGGKGSADRRDNPAPEVETRAVNAAISPAWKSRDPFAAWVDFHSGWPIATSGDFDDKVWWPIHCYGMVGVARGMSPETGDGSALYTVIGHAPRHLDRNIALVGRVIEGMEHLSSLPRGAGALGIYGPEEMAKRTDIISVRMGTEAADVPAFEFLSTDSASFAAYADARANRRDPFFIRPAGGADICNIPVPVRRRGGD